MDDKELSSSTGHTPPVGLCNKDQKEVDGAFYSSGLDQQDTQDSYVVVSVNFSVRLLVLTGFTLSVDVCSYSSNTPSFMS